MTGLLSLLLGAMLAGLVVAIILVATGRWQPQPTRAGSRRRRLHRLWLGPYRGAAQRRAHQRRLMVAAVAGLAVLLYTGIPAFALITAAAIPGAPWLLGAAALEKEAIERLAAIEAWTRRVRDRVVTGTGLQQAMVASRDDAPQPIATEITALVHRLQAGHDPIDALYLLADDLADENADSVITALIRFMKMRGAKLADILGDKADSLGAEIVGRRAVVSKGRSGQLTLKVFTGAGILAAALGILMPGVRAGYQAPAAQAVLLAGTAVFVVLLLVARRVTLPRKPGRFLARPALDPGGAP